MRFLVLLALLAGCAGPPDLGPSPPAASGGWPGLVPIDQLLAQRQGLTITPAVAEGLGARAGGLLARAARLRGPVIAPAERTRLEAAAARLASVARAARSG